MSIAKKYLFLTLFIGLATILGLSSLLWASHHQIQGLEKKLQQLETQAVQEREAQARVMQMAGPGAASSPTDRQIKDLSTRFVGDARSIAEKLRDFLAENAGQQQVAIACKVVADMADNRDALGDKELVWLYQQHPDPALQRVLAQVLSLRGDNSLMDKQVHETQAALKSNQPGERQRALIELGKTHYAGAANAIAPLVQDSDVSVKLDALLALRETGNESHIHYVKNLVNHTDPSVSWLANDVINNLQNLSSKARTRLNSADIAAGLPPMATPGG